MLSTVNFVGKREKSTPDVSVNLVHKKPSFSLSFFSFFFTLLLSFTLPCSHPNHANTYTHIHSTHPTVHTEPCLSTSEVKAQLLTLSHMSVASDSPV